MAAAAAALQRHEALTALRSDDDFQSSIGDDQVLAALAVVKKTNDTSRRGTFKLVQLRCVLCGVQQLVVVL